MQDRNLPLWIGVEINSNPSNTKNVMQQGHKVYAKDLLNGWTFTVPYVLP